MASHASESFSEHVANSKLFEARRTSFQAKRAQHNYRFDDWMEMPSVAVTSGGTRLRQLSHTMK